VFSAQIKPPTNGSIFVARALMRAASRLVSTLAEPTLIVDFINLEITIPV
jgi:hypothetical protein